MAKKTITEYEGAENTVTKIQCGNCDTRWENRGIRGKQGVNTVVLDAKVQERRSYDGWCDEYDSKWNGTSLFGSRPARFTGEAVEDFCQDCWQGFLPDTALVEVEEPEYYVEEKEREEYFCDFCEEHMGEEPTHIVSLNPYITIEERFARDEACLSAMRRLPRESQTRAFPVEATTECTPSATRATTAVRSAPTICSIAGHGVTRRKYELESSTRPSHARLTFVVA